MSQANGSELDHTGRSRCKPLVDKQVGAVRIGILYLIIMVLAAVATVMPIFQRTRAHTQPLNHDQGNREKLRHFDAEITQNANELMWLST
jgi:hypothetical protein